VRSQAVELFEQKVKPPEVAWRFRLTALPRRPVRIPSHPLTTTRRCTPWRHANVPGLPGSRG
jgi:hypothetical protein